MWKAKKIKELVLLLTKSVRVFPISNMFITASNRALGRGFYSLQSNLHELCVIHVASVL